MKNQQSTIFGNGNQQNIQTIGKSPIFIMGNDVLQAMQSFGKGEKETKQEFEMRKN